MPTIRQFIEFGALALGLAVTSCDAGIHPAEEPLAPPNVLFIAVDDLRPELGAYGNPHVRTPAIDQLARGGFTFHRAYVQQAVCNPSRASVMTGLRPDSLRVWDLRTDFRDSVPDVVTLPQQFVRHGYHAVAIGKVYHNVIPDTLSWSEPKIYLDGYPFDPDAVYRGEENMAIQEARKARILEAGTQDRNIDRFGHWYLKANATESIDGPDDIYYDGAQTTAAIEKLGELGLANRPFFLAIGYYRPHLPFNAPKRYWDLYDPAEIPLAADPVPGAGAPPMAVNNMRELRGYADFRHVSHPLDGRVSEAEARHLKHGYYASVSYVDAQVGRLLTALEELDLADNTIVVLWGDHGWKLGEHGAWGKMTNYEADARAPLILRVPGNASRTETALAPAGTRIDALVEFVDIYPTLVELAGFPLPAHLQGTSTVPLLGNPERIWKKAAFHQFLREGIWVAPDGIEYMGYAVRTDRYRYVVWRNWKTGELAARELYDLQTDPLESVNLVNDERYAGALAELQALMQGGWRAALPSR